MSEGSTTYEDVFKENPAAALESPDDTEKPAPDSEIHVDESNNVETNEEMVEIEMDIEVSILSDLPTSYPSLEENGMTEMIEEILKDEQIEKDVNSCLEDLLENVEKAAKPRKRPNVRKRQIDSSTWIVSKRQKAVQAGKEHV